MSAAPGLAAEFASGKQALDAARRLRADGYRALEIHAPYELPGSDEVLGHERPRWLPRLVLACGVLGALTGYAIQWYTNAWDYPLVVGGRPIHAAPAFVPITFETMVLFGTSGAFLGWLAGFGAGRLWRPIFEVPEIERATDDRFWLVVGGRDPHFDATRTAPELLAHGALQVVPLEDAR